MKYIGKVPKEKIDEDNIGWLVIEPHVHNDNVVGYFMLLYEDISQPCKWDIWYQTLEVAFEAGEAYSVNKEDWMVISES